MQVEDGGFERAMVATVTERSQGGQALQPADHFNAAGRPDRDRARGHPTDSGRLILMETMPGVSVREVIAASDASLQLAADCNDHRRAMVVSTSMCRARRPLCRVGIANENFGSESSTDLAPFRSRRHRREGLLPTHAVVRARHGLRSYASDSGSARRRWPVSTNSALASAGASGGVPGSPTPEGARVLATKWVSMVGESASRSSG